MRAGHSINTSRQTLSRWVAASAHVPENVWGPKALVSRDMVLGKAGPACTVALVPVGCLGPTPSTRENRCLHPSHDYRVPPDRNNIK